MNKAIEIAKSLSQEAKNNVTDIVKRTYSSILTTEEIKILDEIKEKGYAVIPGFFSPDLCEKTRSEIDQLIEESSENWIDEVGSDHRIYFFDVRSERVKAGFLNNGFILKILENYEKTSRHEGFTLANRVEFKENNLGSGGDWHRDYVKRKQSKALLYLSEVGEQNGPFQYLAGSHKLSSIIKMQQQYGFAFNKNRFSDFEMKEVLKDYESSLVTVTGNPGTLLLVDTRGIHRGSPIVEGKRYAITNYYFFNTKVPKHIKRLNKFDDK